MVQVVCHVGHVMFVVLFEIGVISWCQIKHRSLKLSEYALLNSSVCVMHILGYVSSALLECGFIDFVVI